MWAKKLLAALAVVPAVLGAPPPTKTSSCSETTKHAHHTSNGVVTASPTHALAATSCWFPLTCWFGPKTSTTTSKPAHIKTWTSSTSSKCTAMCVTPQVEARSEPTTTTTTSSTYSLSTSSSTSTVESTTTCWLPEGCSESSTTSCPFLHGCGPTYLKARGEAATLTGKTRTFATPTSSVKTRSWSVPPQSSGSSFDPRSATYALPGVYTNTHTVIARGEAATSSGRTRTFAVPTTTVKTWSWSVPIESTSSSFDPRSATYAVPGVYNNTHTLVAREEAATSTGRTRTFVKPTTTVKTRSWSVPTQSTSSFDPRSATYAVPGVYTNTHTLIARDNAATSMGKTRTFATPTTSVKTRSWSVPTQSTISFDPLSATYAVPGVYTNTHTLIARDQADNTSTHTPRYSETSTTTESTRSWPEPRTTISKSRTETFTSNFPWSKTTSSTKAHEARAESTSTASTRSWPNPYTSSKSGTRTFVMPPSSSSTKAHKARAESTSTASTRSWPNPYTSSKTGTRTFVMPTITSSVKMHQARAGTTFRGPKSVDTTNTRSFASPAATSKGEPITRGPPTHTFNARQDPSHTLKLSVLPCDSAPGLCITPTPTHISIEGPSFGDPTPTEWSVLPCDSAPGLCIPPTTTRTLDLQNPYACLRETDCNWSYVESPTCGIRYLCLNPNAAKLDPRDPSICQTPEEFNDECHCDLYRGKCVLGLPLPPEGPTGPPKVKRDAMPEPTRCLDPPCHTSTSSESWYTIVTVSTPETRSTAVPATISTEPEVPAQTPETRSTAVPATTTPTAPYPTLCFDELDRPCSSTTKSWATINGPVETTSTAKPAAPTETPDIYACTSPKDCRTQLVENTDCGPRYVCANKNAQIDPKDPTICSAPQLDGIIAECSCWNGKCVPYGPEIDPMPTTLVARASTPQPVPTDDPYACISGDSDSCEFQNVECGEQGLRQVCVGKDAVVDPKDVCPKTNDKLFHDQGISCWCIEGECQVSPIKA